MRWPLGLPPESLLAWLYGYGVFGLALCSVGLVRTATCTLTAREKLAGEAPGRHCCGCRIVVVGDDLNVVGEWAWLVTADVSRVGW